MIREVSIILFIIGLVVEMLAFKFVWCRVVSKTSTNLTSKIF
jgi:hypothetical protein